MSYRLIDANAIASQRPEVNDMPCVYADLPSGLDGGHYDMRESDELQRENAKLRELVADMWFWHYEGHIDSESRKRQMLHINAVIQSMRELGIEV